MILPVAITDAVVLVLLCGAPIQVVRSVVGFVVILVKAKHFSRSRADKCLSDKVMNFAHFALDRACKVSTVKPGQA